MNLQQLYYFKTIAELEHFTQAADKLMVTQPSLSHSINDLESELGINLFERQGRNVKLTKYGKIFYEYVSDSLSILDEGRSKLNDFIDPSNGTVSLAYFSSLEEFVPYVVTKYFAETERMHIKFQFYQLPHTSIENSLLDGTADLAFSTEPSHERLDSHIIGEHNMVLIVPNHHPLAKHNEADLSLLGGEDFITYDYQCRIRLHIDEIFRQVGISPRIISETTHDTVIYSSVAANFGIALVPEPLSQKELGFKVLKIKNQIPSRKIYITWKHVRYMSPVVKKFRDFIVKHDLILDKYRNGLIEDQ